MILIDKITDQDLNEKSIEMINPRMRYGARDILIRNDGKIAVFNKSKKNEYKLPGGGIEENENPKDAFKREVLEETGCTVDIIEELGTIEEYKSQDNFKQISYVFVGKVIEDTKNLHLTQKEQEEGAILTWQYPFEALDLIMNSYDNLVASKYESVYHTKFIVLRDSRILQYYLKKNMFETFKFLKENTQVNYLSTINNGKPSCRPFGDPIMFDNKIYVITNKQKNVSKQIANNNNVCIVAYDEENWIRINCALIDDSNNIAAKQAVINEFDWAIEAGYTLDNPNFQILYMDNVNATIYNEDEDVISIHQF